MITFFVVQSLIVNTKEYSGLSFLFEKQPFGLGKKDAMVWNLIGVHVYGCYG